jgi:hypothetical protein
MSDRFRIGLDLFTLDPEYTGGVNTFALGLLSGLYESLPNNYSLMLIVSKRNKKHLSKIIEGKNIEIIEPKVSFFYTYFNRLITYASWFIKEFRIRYWFDKIFRKSLMRSIDSEIDALILPTTTFNFYAVEVYTVLCIHDIQQEFYPNNFTFHQLILRWAPYRLSAWRASTIQVSSEYIKNTITEKFKFTSTKDFFVVPEGVDPHRFSISTFSQRPIKLQDACAGKFIFYPAQIWRHKNHILLMHALGKFRDRMGFEMPCVLTGQDYGYWEEIDYVKKKLGLRLVQYLGRVELSEVIWCYKNSLAVLALGNHESSSLPVREGAVFGKPLICSNIPPNIEASKHINMQLFDVDDDLSLYKAICDIYFDDGSIFKAAIENIEIIKNYHWGSIANNYIKKCQIYAR